MEINSYGIHRITALFDESLYYDSYFKQHLKVIANTF